MAFGYKLPNFNTWGRFWKRFDSGNTSASFSEPFYFRCQFKHIDRAFVNNVLVPPRLGFRSIDQTPQGLGDIVQIAGNENMWWVVVSVFDLGAGFPNEHRGFSVGAPQDESETSDRGLFMPSVSTTLIPPDGAMMMPETPPLDGWDTPLLFLE